MITPSYEAVEFITMATCKETAIENNPEIGKTAIVTGSSSGIGFACIESLLENGVKVSDLIF